MSAVTIDAGFFQLKANPGAVSALNFIVLDLIIITILDIVLSRCVCKLYYRKIDRGHPFPIRSSDIPGVTTFLVGNILYLPNILAIFVKLGFLACILIVDLQIDSEVFYAKETLTTTGRFIYDPRDSVWGSANPRIAPESSQVLHRTVERRWEQVRDCRVEDRAQESVTYYSLAFNLEGNETLDDETADSNSTQIYHIDDSSLRCLFPDNLTDSDINKEWSTRYDDFTVAEVIGCSKAYGGGPCDAATEYTFKSDLPPSFYQSDQYVPLILTVELPFGATRTSFTYWEYSRVESAKLFGEYNSSSTMYEDPVVSCLRTQIGFTDEDSKVFGACLVTAKAPGGFLVERWLLNSSLSSVDGTEQGTFTRKFPGPIFKKDPEIGIFLKAYSLQNPVLQANWLTFSSILVADGSVYKQDTLTLEHRQRDGTVTRLPVFAVIIALVMLCVTVIVRIVVYFTISKDDRPLLNTIDGLSNVVQSRSVNATGSSRATDRFVTIGLTERNNRHHLGPVRIGERTVARGEETAKP